ncbi:MAG: NapC/NirT family cytochrome c [candidate division Zixibacteria bacterium]
MNPFDRRQSDQKRTYFRHPLAAVGGALTLAGLVLFIILLLFDLGSSTENPYRSLVTFIGAPLVVIAGLALFFASVWIQLRSAQKKGERVTFDFSIIPYDPRYRWNYWLFIGLSVVFITGIVYSGYRGYEATDSVAFCGETCHVVMEPQAVTYKNSPHARVACAECHIGPGASFWVKAKFDGIRQLFATARNTFSKPIVTPVANLRPAQETCEGCHWPRQFYGQKLLTHTYYRTDEENSPWTVNLLIKIGGGNPRTGGLEGIHWHMLGSKIEYISLDDKRQEIAWVRMTDEEGNVDIYMEPGAEVPDTLDPAFPIRDFDCMDCHNRPSHTFLPPAKGMNLALSTRRISPELPYIREIGLELLNAEYETKPEALLAIKTKLWEYYRKNYPELAANEMPMIDQAVASLRTIYDQNFFPEMKTDYRVRMNNLSHFVNDGCFRCHDKVKENVKGEKISSDCNTCHLIVAQGPSEDEGDLVSSLAGLEFEHPEDIDGAWKEDKCTDCHTPDSGY